MRMLFTFVAGIGHFEPLVPIARAAQAAGHSVAFGCSPSIVSWVEAAGFAVFSIGARGSEARSEPERTALRPLDLEREDRDLRERFARRAAQSRVAPIMQRCARWRPDVLVCDEVDFGAIVARSSVVLTWTE